MTNYFELYNIPQTFHPDPATVKSKYYELSRLYHPDRFATAGAENTAEPMRMAALNNDAYKTLKNQDSTMAYLLRLAGVLEDEEKYALPPAFLMEMMDLNELVSELEDTPDNENARLQALNALAEQLQAWDTATRTLTDQFDSSHPDTTLLLQIKDMYFRKKYLLRIQERVEKISRL